MSEADASPPGRRQRRRDRTRRAMMRAALQLFGERGYDATTIEDITDAADVAPRTFFHYFASKDDVLFGGHEERRAGLIERFREVGSDRSIPEALHEALLTIVEAFEDDPDFFLERARLYSKWPPLRSAVLRVNEALVEALTEELGERLGLDASRELAPRLAATLAIGAMRCAIDAWMASEGKRDLRGLAVEALTAVRPALDALVGSSRSGAHPRRRGR